jgi:hypothetical protein
LFYFSIKIFKIAVSDCKIRLPLQYVLSLLSYSALTSRLRLKETVLGVFDFVEIIAGDPKDKKT